MTVLSHEQPKPGRHRNWLASHPPLQIDLQSAILREIATSELASSRQKRPADHQSFHIQSYMKYLESAVRN